MAIVRWRFSVYNFPITSLFRLLNLYNLKCWELPTISQIFLPKNQFHNHALRGDRVVPLGTPRRVKPLIKKILLSITA